MTRNYHNSAGAGRIQSSESTAWSATGSVRAFLSLSLYLFLVQSSREISFRPVPFFHSRNIILVCTGSPRSSTHVSQHFDTFEWIDAARPVTPPLRTVCSSVQVQRAGFILSRSSVVTISIRSNRISDRRRLSQIFRIHCKYVYRGPSSCESSMFLLICPCFFSSFFRNVIDFSLFPIYIGRLYCALPHGQSSLWKILLWQK